MNNKKLIESLKRILKNGNTDIKTFKYCIKALINNTDLKNKKDLKLLEDLKEILKSLKPIPLISVIVPSQIKPIKPKKVKSKPKIKDILKTLKIDYFHEKFHVYCKFQGKQLKLGKNFLFRNKPKSNTYIGYKYLYCVETHKKGVWNRKQFKVLIEDFYFDVNKENQALAEMFEFVRDFHKDIFKRLCKRFHRYMGKFESVRFSLGRVAGKGGHYNRPINTILLNKRRYRKLSDQSRRDLLLNGLETMYHEMIHIFIYHHKGYFHFYNNMFRESIENDDRFNKLIPKIDFLTKIQKW